MEQNKRPKSFIGLRTVVWKCQCMDGWLHPLTGQADSLVSPSLSKAGVMVERRLRGLSHLQPT